MTCSFKNDTFCCQAFVLSEFLKFTVEFRAHSSLHCTHALRHLRAQTLWMWLPCQLFPCEMLKEETTERVQKKKTAKEDGWLPDLPLCQLSASALKRPVASSVLALHLSYLLLQILTSMLENHEINQCRRSSLVQADNA